MIHKIGRMRFRKVERLLNKNGYYLKRTNGSHSIFENKEGNKITVPRNSGSTVNKHILKQIIKKNGIKL